MSDFDVVLERLLLDPVFAASLTAHPTAALAGYRLDAAEVALLCSQAGGDPGSASTVERRITTSSTFGLLAPLAAIAESFADGLGGAPAATSGSGPAPVATSGFGSAPGDRAGSSTGGTAGSDVGGASGRVIQALGAPYARTGLGAPPAATGFGEAPRSGVGGSGTVYSSAARAEEPWRAGGSGHAGEAARAEPAPPKGYHNRVDADGDGTWDRATYRGRAGGGVDILVDLNGDGRTDFVGHDVDADRTVDSADYDIDHDGVFEKRMFDDDGDGWLDRSQRRPS